MLTACRSSPRRSSWERISRPSASLPTLLATYASAPIPGRDRRNWPGAAELFAAGKKVPKDLAQCRRLRDDFANLSCCLARHELTVSPFTWQVTSRRVDPLLYRDICFFRRGDSTITVMAFLDPQISKAHEHSSFRSIAMRNLWISVLLCACFSAAALAEGPIGRVDVFVSGKDGYHTYRIPALAVAAGRIALGLCRGPQVQRR